MVKVLCFAHRIDAFAMSLTPKTSRRGAAALLCALGLLAACGEHGNRRLRDKGPFSTTQSGRLFFKNVRSFYYEKSELPGNEYVRLYRLEKCRDSIPNAAYFNLTIADNYREERAILLLEPNAVLRDAPRQTIYYEGTTGLDSVPWPDEGPAANRAFAHHLDSLLANDRLLWVKDGKQRHPLFQNKLDRDCLGQQLDDYEKLITRK
jgi:hypothetical protein